MDDATAASRPDHEGLFATATEQAGYFTTAQARGSGFSSPLLTHHAKSGRFVRVARGLYRLRDYRPARGPSRARLEQLIEEATVDCYNESEECTGLFTMIEENLDIPFVTTVLGVVLTVTAVDITDDDQIVAVCRRGRDLLRVALSELPMPDPRPAGAEWVDAYRHWARPR